MVTYGTVIKYDDPNYKKLVQEAYSFAEGKDDVRISDDNIYVRIEQIPEAEVLQQYRSRRERECFPYINRGDLWYGKLTEEQKSELDAWYTAWLDVTKTRAIPIKPEWLV